MDDIAQRPVETATYTQLQQFYAEHMSAIDDGEVERWLDTFTEDATIANNARPQPARGRATIAVVAHRLVAEARAQRVVHRHWTGMLQAVWLPDGAVQATSYAMVVETPTAGSPHLWRSTRCQDTLVHSAGRWRIRERYVRHDDVG